MTTTRPDVLVIAPFALDHDRGSPLRSRRLLAAARALDLDVEVLAYRPLPGDAATTGCRLPLAPPRHPGFSWRKPLFDLELLIRAVIRCLRVRPAVIEGHVHEGLLIALLACLVTPRSRVVFNAHGTLADELVATGHIRRGGLLHRFARAAERRLERRADHCLAQSRHRAARLEAHGVAPGRITVCPDAPERELFALQRVAGGGDGRVTCVYTGSLNAYQGIDDLLAAAAATRGVRYVIFGSPSGAYPERVRSLGIEDRVTVVDPAPTGRLPEVLAAADIAVAPRTYGGNVPGKVPAYLAAGLPVVGTDVAGVREAVPGHAGVLVPPSDPAALAAAIQRLADDAELRAGLALGARAHARRAFGPERVRRALRDCYLAGGEAA